MNGLNEMPFFCLQSHERFVLREVSYFAQSLRLNVIVVLLGVFGGHLSSHNIEYNHGFQGRGSSQLH